MKITFTTKNAQLNPRPRAGRTRVTPGGEALLAQSNRLSTFLGRLLCATAFLLPAFASQSAVVVSSLHLFQPYTSGAHPNAGLVLGSDGNFYGTTFSGGTNGGYGTVFKMSTNGQLTSLYSFTGGVDGAYPLEGGLVQASDGNFYGTTEEGGTYGDGTVFKISANGALTSLHSFSGASDGSNPNNGLVQGSDGNLYGTTGEGGADDFGTVFKISTNGALVSLYSFTGGSDGAYPPEAGLVQGSDGNFYGTTAYGGTSGVGFAGYGTVFKISPGGVLASLYSFTNGSDGANPNAGLAQGADSKLYGTTEGGGMDGVGTVFNLSTNGVLSTLYSFTGGSDGASPNGGLVQGADFNFYGTTYLGGSNGSYGTIFKITTNGALTSLHSFMGGSDGANPRQGRLALGGDGNFYGATDEGGTEGVGALFKISTNGVLNILFYFTGGEDGAYPEAGLVQGGDGNFYGTTDGGGVSGGYGTVFQIGANGTFASLYSFSGDGHGGYPAAGLALGSDGNLYGTTQEGGAYTNIDPQGNGTVFKITTNGNLTSIYYFTGGDDGAFPVAGLAQGSDGNFYGTTYLGGSNVIGTVFKISTNGALANLHSFNTTDGSNPFAGLVQGFDGNFYGTTFAGGIYGNGTLFKISTNGTLTSLYSFTGGADGATPRAGLVQGSNGNFYGTTTAGGTNGSFGTVFEFSTNGTLTSLHSFAGGIDGGNPVAGLVQGSDGNLYGTTSAGGTKGAGTIFKISTNGTWSSLYSFTGGSDGAYPAGMLVQGTNGIFYGTTEEGGSGGVGAVFRMTVVPQFLPLTLSNGVVNLTWSSEVGSAYELQSTTNLNSTNWSNLVGPITATAATTSASDTRAAVKARFYRVQVLSQ